MGFFQVSFKDIFRTGREGNPHRSQLGSSFPKETGAAEKKNQFPGRAHSLLGKPALSSEANGGVLHELPSYG